MKGIVRYFTNHKTSKYICIVLCNVSIGVGVYIICDAMAFGDYAIFPAILALIISHLVLWNMLGDKEKAKDA